MFVIPSVNRTKAISSRFHSGYSRRTRSLADSSLLAGSYAAGSTFVAGGGIAPGRGVLGVYELNTITVYLEGERGG